MRHPFCQGDFLFWVWVRRTVAGLQCFLPRSWNGRFSTRLQTYTHSTFAATSLSRQDRPARICEDLAVSGGSSSEFLSQDIIRVCNVDSSGGTDKTST
jgi:hypothetical protein